MSNRNSTIIEGVSLAAQGDLAMAQRDQFRKLYLTERGREIYNQAVRDYEATQDRDRLESDVAKAVDA